MTDRQGTWEETTEVGSDHPQWRVEGAESYGDGGLGDTVVRLPKITDDGAEPQLPAPPKSRPKAGRPAKDDSAPATEEKPAPAPEGRKKPVAAAPVRPSATSAFAEPGPLTFTAPVVAAVASAPAPVASVPAAAVPASPASATKNSGLRRTRKARLRLSRVDPWSVMKTSFLFSIAFGIMFWVAVSVVWTVIVSSGLFDAINQQIANLLSSPTSQSNFRIDDYISTNKVLGITALLAVVNVVISTALGTLVAFLYNLSANILGGLELTLAED